MATTIGTENKLNELLYDLIQLDFDAIEAYEAAIERIDDADSRRKLTEFMSDHREHTETLSTHLRELGETPPHKGDAKRMLTKGKVILADMKGDGAILKAMKTNEDDTNTAYERAISRDDTPAPIRGTLEKNLADERRHRAWIEERAAQL